MFIQDVQEMLYFPILYQELETANQDLATPPLPIQVYKCY